MNGLEPEDEEECAPDTRGQPSPELTEDEIEAVIRQDQRALEEGDPFLRELVREGLITHWDGRIVRPEELGPARPYRPAAVPGVLSTEQRIALYESAFAEIAGLLCTEYVAEDVRTVINRTAARVGKTSF